MRAIIISAFLLLCGLTTGAYGQVDQFRQTLGVNGNLSTCGIGADVYWNFSPQLSLRAGYSRLSFDMDIDFDQNNLKLDTDIRYITHGLTVGIDYQFLKVMYATAGLSVFRFKPKGRVVPVSALEFGDIALAPETMGSATIRVKNKAGLSPYIGVGVGKLTPTQKVSFAFEIGTYYMGSPKITIDASGMLEPNADPEHAALLSKQISRYRFYPVVKFSVGVKLFTFKK